MYHQAGGGNFDDDDFDEDLLQIALMESQKTAKEEEEIRQTNTFQNATHSGTTTGFETHSSNFTVRERICSFESAMLSDPLDTTPILMPTVFSPSPTSVPPNNSRNLNLGKWH